MKDFAREHSIPSNSASGICGTLRNGMLHKGRPNYTETRVKVRFKRQVAAITASSDIVYVDPWKLRDWIIKRHDSDIKNHLENGRFESGYEDFQTTKIRSYHLFASGNCEKKTHFKI